MSYLDAANAAARAENYAAVIPSGGGEPWLYNLSATLTELARSQRALAEQLHRDA